MDVIEREAAGASDVSVLQLDAPARPGVGLHTYAAGVRIADVVLMMLATAVGWTSWANDPSADSSNSWAESYLMWAVPLVVVWYCVLEAADAYDIVNVGGAVGELKAVFAGTTFVAAGLAIADFLFTLGLSRAFFSITFLLGAAFLLLSHFVVRRLLHRAHCQGLYMRSVVAVGSRGAIGDLVGELEREKWAGLEVVAACVPDEQAWDPIGNVHWVFPTASLHDVVADTGAKHVFLVAGAGESPRHIRRIAWSLEGTDASLAVVPRLTDIARGRIRPKPVAGLPLIELDQPEFTGVQSIAKRTFDLLGSASGLILLSPLFAAMAFLIRREDGGPVFYRQIRVGQESQEFSCYKFRSMHIDADARLEDLQHHNEGHGLLFKMREDPRITDIGRTIRKYSIDELPQLINVLRGEMSLVGPRPPLPREVEMYHSDMTRRLKVRPGMTGLWQVSGRSHLTAEESERLDLYYVDNWSMSQDLVILWKTIRVVVTGHGAY
jgi:exopolysaccharide biosynthesis polyprenyl glycosylphosphotransferase